MTFEFFQNRVARLKRTRGDTLTLNSAIKKRDMSAMIRNHGSSWNRLKNEAHTNFKIRVIRVETPGHIRTNLKSFTICKTRRRICLEITGRKSAAIIACESTIRAVIISSHSIMTCMHINASRRNIMTLRGRAKIKIKRMKKEDTSHSRLFLRSAGLSGEYMSEGDRIPRLYNENVIYLMWCNERLKVKWKNECLYELGFNERRTRVTLLREQPLPPTTWSHARTHARTTRATYVYKRVLSSGLLLNAMYNGSVLCVCVCGFLSENGAVAACSGSVWSSTRVEFSS